MTLTRTTLKISYQCDGGTSEFSFGFRVFDEDDVTVILTDSADTVDEKGTGNGVTADGVLLKDGGATLENNAGLKVKESDDTERLMLTVTGSDDAVVGNSNLPLYLENDGTLRDAPTDEPIPHGNVALRYKVLPIGDWDMNGTFSVDVAHGLTLANIRPPVDVMILNDAGDAMYPLAYPQAANNMSGGFALGGTNITLFRFAGGFFDDTGFDSTGYNRGFITIWYTE
jgi:hypothetical protein